MKRIAFKRVSFVLGSGLLVLASTIQFGISSQAFAAAAPTTPPAGSSIDDRIALRKKERPSTMNDKDVKRLISKCIGAQSAITPIQHNNEPIFSNRTTTYTNIDGTLWVAIGRLKLANQDTFGLEKIHNDLVSKIAAFQLTAANMQQTLTDSITMNCQADPAGFRALVDTAQAYYSQLKLQSADISGYIVNSVTPTLNKFADQLQPNNPGGKN